MPGNYQEAAAVSVVQGTAADFLRGRWRIRRRIVDHRAGVEGSFVGEAEFDVDLTYHENGEIRYNGHRGPAGRTLRFVPRDRYRMEVRFADGRDFYELDLRADWTA